MAENEKKRKLTYDGLKKLQDELDDLRINRVVEIATKIREAREQGDLSENAEFDAAREEQGKIHARINEIEEIIKNAEIVEEGSTDSDAIDFACTVRFEDMESKEEFEYKILGSTECNIFDGSISDESPIGSKLIGAKVGQVITVNAPNGKFNYKILDFKRG